MTETAANPYLQYLEVISNSPLVDGDAEIRFTGGSIIYRVKRDGHQQIKGLSPQSLRQAFATAPIDSGWHSAHLVRNGFSRDWWGLEFYPPQIYCLQAWGEKYKIPMPGLYWLGMGNSYYLLATDRRQHHPHNTLFYPPTSNIFDELTVCWGQNNPPPASAASLSEAWAMFWSAEFTPHNTHGRLAQGDIPILWQYLHDKKRKRFSKSDLLPLGMNLEQLIRLKTGNAQF